MLQERTTVSDTFHINLRPGKEIRDGMVAVILSEEPGLGWYTQHEKELLLFDPIIVRMIEFQHNPQDIIFHAIDTCGVGSYVAAPYLTVTWVKQGTKFTVMQIDGIEQIVTEDPTSWVVA